jgi:hypothetical protein
MSPQQTFSSEQILREVEVMRMLLVLWVLSGLFNGEEEDVEQVGTAEGAPPPSPARQLASKGCLLVGTVCLRWRFQELDGGRERGLTV